MVDLKNELKQAAGPESFQAPETQVESPETKKESLEKPEQKPTEPTETTSGAKKFFKRHQAPAHFLPPLKDPFTQKIEKILEADVGDAYARLSPIAREEFKIKGEATAKIITELLRSTHVKVKKIFQLIFKWLKVLPGINHFFLEQEAKIKTDQILTLRDPK